MNNVSFLEADIRVKNYKLNSPLLNELSQTVNVK